MLTERILKVSVPHFKYENTGVISQNSVIEERKVEQSYATGFNNAQFRDSQSMQMPKAADLPMKWYKFLIYFSLFFSAVISILGVIGTIPLLFIALPVFYKIFFVIFSICSLAIAIFAIYTRQMLAGFKTNAVNCLYALYIVSNVTGIIYYLILANYMGAIGLVIFLIIWLTLNNIYFKKRKHLFVN